MASNNKYWKPINIFWMKVIFLSLFYIIFAFYCSKNTVAQSWYLLNRQQKDSVIYNHTNKNNKYIGVGFNFGIIGGARKGGWLKLEPTFGYFFINRSLIAGSLTFEKGWSVFDTNYIKSYQITVGSFYRYYLPERTVLSPLFAQAGLYTGKFFSHKHVDNLNDKIEPFVFNLIVGFGISLPINKFTLEIGMNYEYKLINRSLFHGYYGGKALGILNFSYIF